MTLTVGALCEGIGGLGLGLERAGMRVAWHAEIDLYCARVLAQHWPAVPNHGDIKTIDWSSVERVDLISAGYPCQPFANPGDRRGAKDERHLWPYVAEAVRCLRPRWVLLENVQGHLSLGFDQVLADLAGLGFDAEWSLVSACSLGAPHMRKRLFVVAYPHGEHGRDRPDEDTPLRGSESVRRSWFPLAEPADGGWWDSEPDVDRVADGVPFSVERRRALGNAAVPAVAEHIGHLILAAIT